MFLIFRLENGGGVLRKFLKTEGKTIHGNYEIRIVGWENFFCRKFLHRNNRDANNWTEQGNLLEIPYECLKNRAVAKIYAQSHNFFWGLMAFENFLN